jgi:hypothetical protein
MYEGQRGGWEGFCFNIQNPSPCHTERSRSVSLSKEKGEGLRACPDTSGGEYKRAFALILIFKPIIHSHKKISSLQNKIIKQQPISGF